ncbi:MAG: ABC transporter [Hyphomicrobium sp.]|nr:MAG: ABC transporter [Hyphomicrobium sp.]PPD01691.1 MAG: ABC transporter [Hyphomicrobium sp.]
MRDTVTNKSARLRADQIFVHRGHSAVLSNINVDIAPGEFVAVVGANGSGKSTLLKTLAGLQNVHKGQVLLGDVALSSYERRTLAKSIAYLPQDRTVHWNMTCERVVALGRLPHRNFVAGDSATDANIITEAMERMDVVRFAQRPIATLSGGEKARVLIARTLAQQATFIIADEPTAGLDYVHTLQFCDELRRIASQRRAIIIALHDLSIAARYADRIVILRRGACIANGPPAQVLSTGNLAAAFDINSIVTEVNGMPVVLAASPLTSESGSL